MSEDARVRAAVLIALPSIVACGDDAGITRVAALWQHDAAAVTAPAGVGAEGRVLVALKETAGATGGRVVTLQDFDGAPIEGPFDGVPITDHAPVMVEGRIFVLTKIGGLVGLSLAGDTLFTNPPVGGPSATAPLTVAGDTVRWGTASGFVASVGVDGMERFRAPVGDPVTTPVAVGSDGRTYATTDTGRVIALDTAGGVAFDVRVDAPASGPLVTPGGVVVVGEGTGFRALDSSGGEKWRRPRGARGVGAAFMDGVVVAWGEDGRLEGLGPDDGAVRFTFATGASNPPPIYVAPIAVDGGYGVLDAAGTAHLVSESGASLATFSLGAEPAREVVGTNQTMYVSIGSTVRAIRFIHAPAE